MNFSECHWAAFRPHRGPLQQVFNNVANTRKLTTEFKLGCILLTRVDQPKGTCACWGFTGIPMHHFYIYHNVAVGRLRLTRPAQANAGCPPTRIVHHVANGGDTHTDTAQNTLLPSRTRHSRSPPTRLPTTRQRPRHLLGIVYTPPQSPLSGMHAPEGVRFPLRGDNVTAGGGRRPTTRP